MSKPLADRIPFAKIVTVLAIVLGVSFGLCGLNWVLVASNQGRGMGGFAGPILGTAGILELCAILLSAVALVLTVAAWVAFAILDSFSRGNAEPATLFDSKDDTEK